MQQENIPVYIQSGWPTFVVSTGDVEFICCRRPVSPFITRSSSPLSLLGRRRNRSPYKTNHPNNHGATFYAFDPRYTQSPRTYKVISIIIIILLLYVGRGG